MWKGSQQMAKMHTTTIIILTTWGEGTAGGPINTVGWVLSSPCHWTVWVGLELFITLSSKEAERPSTLRLKDPGYSSQSVAQDCHQNYSQGLVRN